MKLVFQFEADIADKAAANKVTEHILPRLAQFVALELGRELPDVKFSLLNVTISDRPTSQPADKSLAH